MTDIYWKYEQKCRKYTIHMIRYVFCHQQTLVVALVHSIYCICTGNLETSTWGLPFYMAVPFDTARIFNWFILWFFQFNTIFSYSLPMSSTTLYFVCCCLYIAAACDHFKFVIHSVNESVKKYRNMPQNYVEMHRRITQNISQAIDIHSKIYE